MTDYETMKSDFTGGGSFRRAQGAANLMAHPMAAFAAGSAVAFGMASHAFGLWAGAMTGAAGAAERTMRAGLNAIEGADEHAFMAPLSVPVRTRAAVETLVEDARSTAREVVSTSQKVARQTADDAKDMLDAPGKAARAAAGDARQAAADIVDLVKPAGIAKPAKPDDLKAISGVGPKLEQVLNGLGIWTYGQIAAWSQAEIDWIDDYLAFKGRIARDGWIEQAKALGNKQ